MKYLLMFLFGVIMFSGEVVERHYTITDNRDCTILVIKNGTNYTCHKLKGLVYIKIGSLITVERTGRFNNSWRYLNYNIKQEE